MALHLLNLYCISRLHHCSLVQMMMVSHLLEWQCSLNDPQCRHSPLFYRPQGHNHRSSRQFLFEADSTLQSPRLAFSPVGSASIFRSSSFGFGRESSLPRKIMIKTRKVKKPFFLFNTYTDLRELVKGVPGVAISLKT